MTPAGFPHSDIPGSQPACGSPGLIAACYVLRRRSAPRHPPFTLSSLTTHKPETLACSALENPIELSKTISRSRRTSPHLERCREDRRGLVEQIGLEPTTSALQGRRSPN
jgi:hypothetical protein